MKNVKKLHFWKTIPQCFDFSGCNLYSHSMASLHVKLKKKSCKEFLLSFLHVFPFIKIVFIFTTVLFLFIPKMSYASSLTPIPPVTFSITPTTIPTSSPSDTNVSLTLGLHGIGSVGDNLNPSGPGNSNPIHTMRNVTLHVYNSTPSHVANVAGTVTFDTTSGLFQGEFDLGKLSSGTYSLFVITPGFLKKELSRVTLASQQTTTLSTIYLVNGDILSQNTLSILDYNMIYSCFGSRQNSSTCLNPQGADLNDDGVVDGIDYNIFLREYVSQRGHAGDQEPTNPSPLVTVTPTKVPTITPTPRVTPTIAPSATPTPTSTPSCPTITSGNPLPFWRQFKSRKIQ